MASKRKPEHDKRDLVAQLLLQHQKIERSRQKRKRNNQILLNTANRQLITFKEAKKAFQEAPSGQIQARATFYVAKKTLKKALTNTIVFYLERNQILIPEEWFFLFIVKITTTIDLQLGITIAKAIKTEADYDSPTSITYWLTEKKVIQYALSLITSLKQQGQSNQQITNYFIRLNFQDIAESIPFSRDSDNPQTPSSYFFEALCFLPGKKMEDKIKQDSPLDPYELVNTQTYGKETILHVMVKYIKSSYLNNLKWILNYNPELTIRDHYGNTALHTAILAISNNENDDSHAFIAVLHYAVSKNFDFSSQNKKGESIFHLLATCPPLSIIKENGQEESLFWFTITLMKRNNIVISFVQQTRSSKTILMRLIEYHRFDDAIKLVEQESLEFFANEERESIEMRFAKNELKKISEQLLPLNEFDPICKQLTEQLKKLDSLIALMKSNASPVEMADTIIQQSSIYTTVENHRENTASIPKAISI